LQYLQQDLVAAACPTHTKAQPLGTGNRKKEFPEPWKYLRMSAK